jgi:hypothetical protein
MRKQPGQKPMSEQSYKMDWACLEVSQLESQPEKEQRDSKNQDGKTKSLEK